MKKRTAVIGVGSMGGGIAGSLLRAGFQVAVYDIREEAMRVLGEQGARVAKSPKGAASDSDVVIVDVQNFAQAQSALFGLDGAVQGMRVGSTVIVTSTIGPAEAKALAEPLLEKGIKYLDAPVSGGAVKAKEGTLTILIGGDPATVEEHDDVLHAIGVNIYHMGPAIGDGSTMKLVNQLMAGVSAVVAAEGLVLGTKLGLNPQKLYEIITKSSGNSWMLGYVGPKMLSGDFTPQAPLLLWIKDLPLVLAEAKLLNYPCFMANAALLVFQMAAARGNGKLDQASVVRVYEELAGVEVGARS